MASPEISFSGGDSLRVKYFGYRELPVELEFTDVIGFKRNIAPLDFTDLSDDAAYEVISSVRIEGYRKSGEPVSPHKHYKLCFNAAGILDLIFQEMKVLSIPGI